MRSDPHAERRLLCGWGRTSPTAATVLRPATAAEAGEALRTAGARGAVARGLGRSYGDAAQNAGGAVIDMTGLDRILAVDVAGRTARVQAGVSLDRLMRTLVPLGLWPVVSPGTRDVTVGGAVASDIHGKNHHRDGSFGGHVLSLLLDTPSLGPVEIGPERDAELFWATVGGMGLTGLVLEATVDLLGIETAEMRVDAERLPDFDTLLARLSETENCARYSVAWIDCLARGRRLGRSILELGDHAGAGELPSRRRGAPLSFSPPRKGSAPPWAPPHLLNRWSVAAFNEAWYRKTPARVEGHLVPAARFFHPLDAVAGWNRLYGRRGFVQYQLVVPDGAEAELRHAVELFSAARCASFLAVLKRFGPSDPAPLSFPRPGWTLALDLPAGGGELARLLDRLDEMVAAAGGRVYLSKDSRLRPELLEVMYPQLPRWREVRERADPDRRLCSDLARRLPLADPLPVPGAGASRPRAAVPPERAARVPA
jgi:decaprenylphospho-beta-D-ribofuranose 2-oxidase